MSGQEFPLSGIPGIPLGDQNPGYWGLAQRHFVRFSVLAQMPEPGFLATVQNAFGRVPKRLKNLSDGCRIPLVSQKDQFWHPYKMSLGARQMDENSGKLARVVLRKCRTLAVLQDVQSAFGPNPNTPKSQ